MGVNHRGPNVFVSQKFLYGANVVTAFDQVRPLEDPPPVEPLSGYAHRSCAFTQGGAALPLTLGFAG